jgi:hypothetical protein
MKEKINEHDFTKNMMNIIRGGYKAKLMTEAEEDVNQNQEITNQEVVNQDNTNEYLGPFPLVYKLSSDYFEISESDDRFVKLKEQIEGIGVGAEVTNVCLSKEGKDLVIFGTVLRGKLQFAMPYLDGEVKKNQQGTINGDEDVDPIKKLQGYLNNLGGDASKTKELLYRDTDDEQYINKKEE